jgi:surface antigen
VSKRGVVGFLALMMAVPLAAPVLADSWKHESRGRGHKVEEKYDRRSGSYKYEEKGPGYKYEYKVDRRGRVIERYKVRSGPPPWAPVHGYRHAYAGAPSAGYLAPFGIDAGRCYRDLIGAAIGGAGGGLLGAQIGKGDGNLAATAAGVFIGAIVGGAVGRGMDQVDQACVGQVLEHAPDGQHIVWSTDNSPQYAVVPTQSFRTRDGTYCREYQAMASIGGQPQRVYGTACRMPDGSWKISG